MKTIIDQIVLNIFELEYTMYMSIGSTEQMAIKISHDEARMIIDRFKRDSRVKLDIENNSQYLYYIPTYL